MIIAEALMHGRIQPITEDASHITRKLIALLEQDRKEQRELFAEKVESGTYDEDHEDPGAEAIAEHAYGSPFEAFMFGYNQACKEMITLLQANAHPGS